jgi:3-hydroxyacyl-[acyl-carrier-protein] dehydratase
MLLNNLYQLISFIRNENGISVVIKLNGAHPVFQGHFPGNPILPGICTVEIARELLEKAMNKKLILRSAGNIKYLGFISPSATPEVQFNLAIQQNSTETVSGKISVVAAGTVVCSFKGEYSSDLF